jgi:hypothetical protein
MAILQVGELCELQSNTSKKEITMQLSNFQRELIAAGHASVEDPTFTEPQTLAGDYRATNGFWYYCGWNSGKSFTSKIGYSSEFLAAVEKAEQRGIFQLPESYNEWLAAICPALGLAPQRVSA